MTRTMKVLSVLCALVGAMLATAAPASAAGPRCQVRNATLGASYGSATGAALTNAIAAARPGDRLVVAGTCTGSFTVTKDLTIAGRHPGARRPVLDGNHAGGVLFVEIETTVTLTDLVITHGIGGVANFGNVKAIRTAVTGNDSDQGAGVLNRGGFLTLTRSSVTNNHAFAEGGGVFNTGTLVTWATTIAGNSSGGAGGGIYTEQPTALHKSLVTRNMAADGGGIFALSGTPLTLDRTRVVGNQPDNCDC
jgi:hypothetical protein